MDRAAFYYELPPELIAQAPLAERSASRLLALDGQTGALTDRRFVDLVDWLDPADLLVLNDTRVLPARLQGRKASGGRVELLELARCPHHKARESRIDAPSRRKEPRIGRALGGTGSAVGGEGT